MDRLYKLWICMRKILETLRFMPHTSFFLIIAKQCRRWCIHPSDCSGSDHKISFFQWTYSFPNICASHVIQHCLHFTDAEIALWDYMTCPGLRGSAWLPGAYPSCHFELYQDKYDLVIVPNLAAYQNHLESNYETQLLSPILKTFKFVSSKSLKLQF